MNCKRYEELMSAALDGELSAQERQELDRHLAECPACAALFDELREQCAALRELDCSFPDGLHDQIMNSLPEQEKVPVRRAVHWRRWGAMAACLVLVAAARLLTLPPPVSGEPMLASGSSGPTADEGISCDDEAPLLGDQFGPCAEGGDIPVQRSTGADPEPVIEGINEKSIQPAAAPYVYTAAGEDGAGAPVHYGFANDQYIRVAYGYTPEPGAQIIGSAQSLEEFLEQFPFDGLLGLLPQYDEEYFESGRLLAVVVEEPSGSIRHQIAFQGLLRDQVTVVQTEPYQTEDMAAWLILAEVDATFNDGDELSVTVVPYEEAKP